MRSSDVAARKPVTGLEIKEKESVSQLFQLKSLDRQDTWYPTLRKTVWVLSQLHDFVKVRYPRDDACTRGSDTPGLARYLRRYRSRGREPMPAIAGQRG